MRSYIPAALLICLAAFSFTFFSGPTAVFLGVACVLVAAVLTIRGIQHDGDRNPDSPHASAASNPSNNSDLSTYDWDANFRDHFGA